MAKKQKNDSNVVAAGIISKRGLIGVIVGTVIAGIVSVFVAIITRHPTPPPTEPITFSGRVYNRNNTSDKVRNAQVALEVEGIPALVTTDSEGIFSFP
jgi:hypothetical protein